MNRNYGWRKSNYRPKQSYQVPHGADVKKLLNTPYDLRAGFPDKPYDQGQLGSCVDNAGAGMIRFVQKRNNNKFSFMPSRLFMYYNVRALEGTTFEDSGSTITDYLISLKNNGVVPENENPLWSWPYSDDPITFRIKPHPYCYVRAKDHKLLEAEHVPQNELAIASLLDEGYVIEIGFLVYESFESNEVAKTGIVPMPGENESVLGGHAVLICGQMWIGKTKYYIMRNSWGTGWGDKGYFYMPAQYILDSNLADDFVVIKAMT